MDFFYELDIQEYLTVSDKFYVGLQGIVYLSKIPAHNAKIQPISDCNSILSSFIMTFLKAFKHTDKCYSSDF